MATDQLSTTFAALADPTRRAILARLTTGECSVTELAELLGGQLGVSRVVTSLGWRPHHEQVGQTGSRIAPDLYVPCGISGAIQHWAGCASSKTILASNTDVEGFLHPLRSRLTRFRVTGSKR